MEIDALDSEGGPALDAERIAACQADKRSGEFFLVDANGGLLPETAPRMLRMLPPGLDFVIEAPCATWRETMSLRQRCPYPIIIDELAQQDDDIAFALAHDVADGIGLKISKAGGLPAAEFRSGVESRSRADRFPAPGPVLAIAQAVLMWRMTQHHRAVGRYHDLLFELQALDFVLGADVGLDAEDHPARHLPLVVVLEHDGRVLI
jgi:Enolase C-terminal domain-like